MKKFIFVVLSFILILSLVACDKGSTSEHKDNNGELNASDEIVTKVTYANWTEDEGKLMQICLNSETMSISSVRHLPVLKFEAKAELDKFKEDFKGYYTMDIGYDDMPSFNDITANYDDDFFKNHTVILAYISASSGSFRYGVSEVVKENEILIMKVEQLNHPEVYTDDMSGWFAIAEVEKEYIKDCAKFDAQFVMDNIINNNKITITNGKNDYDSINVDRIKEFINNSNSGIDDEIEVTQYTIEGDPIITTVRYDGVDGTFEIVMDTTQDKFGTPEIITKEYDNTYKAKLSGEVLVDKDNERSYYTFELVNEEDVVGICTFSY